MIAFMKSSSALFSFGVIAALSLSMPSNSFAQGSLSGSEATQAKTLLRSEVPEAYLESQYYKDLIEKDDIYGRLPDEMRRIFARIRLVALSIDDTDASDQVLNALSRAYLIYDMEAAAINEAVKIILPKWKARTLIDISDYYNLNGATDKRDELLKQALDLLQNTQQDEEITRQYFFDIASRYALNGEGAKSTEIINFTFDNPINRIMGYLQIAERVELNEPSNALTEKGENNLLDQITRCKPTELFALPNQKAQALFSLRAEQEVLETDNDSKAYIQESYKAFSTLIDNNEKKLRIGDLKVLLNLNTRLFEYGMKQEAHDVLNTIVAQFITAKNAYSDRDFLEAAKNNPGDDNFSSQMQLRNALIKAYIRMNQIRSGMDLTADISDSNRLSMAYISAGIAHNETDNPNAATALFNYAQDVALLIEDDQKRDAVLLEVIRGQALARLYGSAFHNISQIRLDEYRAEAFYAMAQQMIHNDDLSFAVRIAKYIQPHDLRIQILANLAYIRSLNPDDYYTGTRSMPETQTLFQEIYTLMETSLVGGKTISTDAEPSAILMALCADAKRQDLFDRKKSGSPLDIIKKAEYQKLILDAATDYTASITDIVPRAKSFSNIAQMLIEAENFKDAQLYMDTAWNLAWSIRDRLSEETDTIFLRIVRGKIISNQITDAYNIATGMGVNNDPAKELMQDLTTGEITYSDRIQALMDFSRAAMSAGEYSIALRAIDDIQVGTAKSVAMTNAIRDLIKTENAYNIDGILREAS